MEGANLPDRMDRFGLFGSLPAAVRPMNESSVPSWPWMPATTTTAPRSQTTSLQRPQFISSVSYILSRANRQRASMNSSIALGSSSTIPSNQTNQAQPLNWGSNPPPDLASLPKTLAAPPLTLVPGTKRKRSEDDQSEEPESLGPSSAQPTSPDVPVSPVDELLPVIEKPVLRKKKTSADAILRCENCTRTSSSTSNPLVTCAECYESWHQHCHDPHINPLVVSGKAPLRCSRCVGEELKVREYERAKVVMEERQAAAAAYSSVDATRERNLRGLPEPPKMELVGFGAGDSTTEERVGYFTSLKKTDLINLLSFSDAIKPGLLVDVLSSIAKNHPDLPIFDHPEWAQGGDKAQSPQPAGAHAKATTSLRRPKNKKHRISAIRKVQDMVTVPLGMVDQPEDYMPPQWPKVGQGMYAQLGPEEKDPWMYDDDDEEVFSHWMVGGDGKQIIPPVQVVV